MEKPIDPLVEFNSRPLEYKESIELIREIDHYLEEEARPILTAVKKFGMIVLNGLANSGIIKAFNPPPISEK